MSLADVRSNFFHARQIALQVVEIEMPRYQERGRRFSPQNDAWGFWFQLAIAA